MKFFIDNLYIDFYLNSYDLLFNIHGFTRKKLKLFYIRYHITVTFEKKWKSKIIMKKNQSYISIDFYESSDFFLSFILLFITYLTVQLFIDFAFVFEVPNIYKIQLAN